VAASILFLTTAQTSVSRNIWRLVLAATDSDYKIHSAMNFFKVSRIKVFDSLRFSFRFEVSGA
jgi:hypothetical protein